MRFVAFWHKADKSSLLLFVRFRGQSGHWLGDVRSPLLTHSGHERALSLRCTGLTCYSLIILGFGVSAMRRREFIRLLGGAASGAALALAARAQEAGRTYRLGFLLPSPRQIPPVDALFDELRLNGFIEGKNLVVVPGGF